MSSLVKRAINSLNGVLRRPRTSSAFVAGTVLSVVLSGCVAGVSYPDRTGYDYDNAPSYPAPSQSYSPYYYEQRSVVVPGGYYGWPNGNEQQRWERQRQNEMNARILQENMERAARSMGKRLPPPPPRPAVPPPPVRLEQGPQGRPGNPNAPWGQGRAP